MGTLNKVVNGFIKFVFIVVGLLVAVVPIVYIYGHESVWRQEWSGGLQRFSGRAGQVEQMSTQKLTNVYLRADASKLTWADVNATLHLANYLHHQLENNGVTVVRRVLEFKKPAAGKRTKGKEGKEAAEEVVVAESNQVAEVPPLRWLKDLVEPYISFEHESLRRKHWIIVCLGELEGKVANEIQNLQKKNGQYRVTLVSPSPVNSKIIDITHIPYEGGSDTALEVIAEQVASVPEKEAKGKEGKAKKEPKIKVKHVKEVKNEGELTNSSKTQEL